MSRLAACPKCRNQFTLPELTGPATVACPFCKALISLTVKPTAAPIVMTVPNVKTMTRAVRDDDDDDDDGRSVDSQGRRGKRSRRSTPSSTGKKIAIMAGILLLTMLCIGGVLWWALSDNQKPVNKQYAGVPEKRQRQLESDEDTEIAEATASEKFEIPDKALIQSDLYQSFIPHANLPGLDINSIKDGNESLAADVLKRVKQNTVYIETERDGGGGTGSGFFAFEKGLVVTNAHVIDMIEEGKSVPKSVRVFLNHGTRDQKDYKVVIVKVDRKHDLALLRLPGAYREECPEPMQLASSQTTRETQKVFSLGFPFGNSAGKEVTVTPLSVTSHRYEDGRMKLVQFGGGSLNPGNSGGPIVDAAGRVVAVAVSIFTGRGGDGSVTNTGISFGVPADEASALFFGRPDRLEVFPPVRKGDSLLLPLFFRLSEFSSNNSSPKVKVVTGDEKNPPENPSGGDEPLALKSGENKQQYSGSLALPELQDGKVYWLQPQLTFGEGKINWLDPLSYTPGKILDDKELPASAAGGTILGELKLKQRYQYVLHSTRGSLSIRMDYGALTSGGTNPIKDLRVGVRANDRAMPHKLLQRYWVNRVPPEEESSSPNPKLTSLLKNNLNQWHDLAQLDIPKEQMSVGKVWKVSQRPVTLDYLFGFEADQQSNLSCEYLGSFQDGNRLVAVIRLQGTIGEGTSAAPRYGRFSGLALIDGNSRQLLDLMLRCDVRKRITASEMIEGSASVDGVMQLRLQCP